MQALGVVTSFGVVGLACVMALHGTANTIDSLAYELHRLAKRIRALHSKRTALVSERWVREIEG